MGEIHEYVSTVDLVVSCVVNSILQRPASIELERAEHLSASIDFDELK